MVILWGALVAYGGDVKGTGSIPVTGSKGMDMSLNEMKDKQIIIEAAPHLTVENIVGEMQKVYNAGEELSMLKREPMVLVMNPRDIKTYERACVEIYGLQIVDSGSNTFLGLQIMARGDVPRGCMVECFKEDYEAAIAFECLFGNDD